MVTYLWISVLVGAAVDLLLLAGKLLHPLTRVIRRRPARRLVREQSTAHSAVGELLGEDWQNAENALQIQLAVRLHQLSPVSQ